jgi:signal transduction histidine kinase
MQRLPNATDDARDQLAAALAELTSATNQETERVTLVEMLARRCAALLSTGMAAAYVHGLDPESSDAVYISLAPQFIQGLEKIGHRGWVHGYRTSRPAPTVRHVWRATARATAVENLAAAQGIKTLVTAPISFRGDPQGLLLLCFTERTEPSEADLQVVHTLATLVAAALAAQRMEQKSRWERRAQNDFLDILSHELRTPLTSIMGFAQMIRRRLVTSAGADTRLREQIDVLWTQAQRLSRLLDTFVDISRVERGELVIERAPVDIVAVLNMAIEQATAQTRNRHPMQVEIPSEALWVDGDARRLEHMFSQLVSNAIRYSAPEKPIDITGQLDSDKGTLEVSISDRGPGIPVEIRRQIFNRFYPSDTRKSGGLGVGLYLSRAIAEAHGGKLELRSTVGKGTTICITLPLG